ncbi:MAG: 50S ribosomal protein L4 [Rhodospirillaceae bacterium]|jgi:large subunit ribosomal protein L4|nr:50S ribosomal protein L4 [Rhodospirillaceae bacterium]MBT3926640.1 50S ribosomal protein L4 [Rhodospirillaceae bacterium]MBT5676554.1 50S ribosomal protein L4 [Rhodospirillaceae bacterium]MBT5777812.1 50S ribosomal protein L4 [Rhodospirillaceae bacterium]MBT6830256.1 50S ribosomal protein L4 [Rhodospirillaceae bacterium]
MKVKVTNLDNKAAGEIELAEAVFGAPVRADLMHRTVRWQLAKRQAGTHKTKTVGEISGTTRKPWKQKGTGRARASSLRSPQFRGGAVIFGPRPRSHAHKLPKKVRAIALRSALSSKQAEGKLIVVDSAALKDAKTSALNGHLAKLKLTSTVLLIDGPEIDGNLSRAARNIPGFDVLPPQGANVYDILRRDTLVLTKNAIELLEARLT